MMPIEPWTSLLGIICYAPLPLDSSKMDWQRTGAMCRPVVQVATRVCDFPTMLAHIEASSHGATDL
jgi:hypothetical protein